MKLKVKPDDFYVVERINISPQSEGRFALYCLEKRFWNTLDLLRYLQRRYKFQPFQRLGLKDRYAHSIQYVANSLVVKKPITEKNFSLRFLGFIDRPLRNENLFGNFFRITLRDLKAEEGGMVIKNFGEVSESGFPNFYDEQRMGEARHRKGFFAKSLILRHYEGALKLYLATPSPDDESRIKRFKRFLKENWGRWEEGLALAPPEYKPVVAYLCKKKRDFKGAIKRIPRDLLELFINAYQAYIWNETLNLLLKNSGLDLFSVPYRFGELYFYRHLPPKFKNHLLDLEIPSPSIKSQFTPKIKEVMEEVLKRDGLRIADLKLRLRLQGIYFKPFLRKAICLPEEMRIGQLIPDELYPNRFKLELSFFLPAGSYATILIKRLTLNA